jgi:hypothetical protein
MEEVNLTEMFESHSKTNAPVHRDHQSISRKISVAPMMDWTGNVEMRDSVRSYEGQKRAVAFW